MKRKFVSLLAVTLHILITGVFIPTTELFAEKESNLPLTIVPLINPKISSSCPTKPERFILVSQHTWSFSPGGQTSVMEITGHTNTDSCDIWVSGDAAIGDDCTITYNNSGKVYTDAGTCTQKGTSTAILSFDKGKCRKGVIIINITEVQNSDAGLGGTLTCQKISEPYITFYPPSLKEAYFAQSALGDTETDMQPTPDAAGYKYNKKWTLMPASAIR